jgi:large subunit ribosomal protein L4
MQIDVFTHTGSKKGTLELSKLFESTVNHGLMHQAVMLQQSNRRAAIAHAKSRGEVEGSTRKLYSQKHTGRARRGSIRSPLLRGGGKAFGPKHVANFQKDMPRSMRRAALLSCLSHQAKRGAILGLESYPDTVKTKEMAILLKKLPIEYGRSVLFVVSEAHKGITMSARNIPGVKILLASYLNPEDILHSRHIIFLVDAMKKAEEMLAKKDGAKLTKRGKEIEGKEGMEESEGTAAKKKSKTAKKPTAKKHVTKKAS